MIASGILQGSFIKLLPMQQGHLDALCAIGLAPALWKDTTIKVATRSDMESYIRSALAAQADGSALPFVIVDKKSDEIIGSTRFHSAMPENRRVEIGYTWLALPRQRTAANTEAKYLMLKHAFEVLNCVRVEFKANAENEPSRRALLRIGAKEEGILRSCRVSPTGKIFDLAVFSIISQEWPKMRADLEAKLSRKL